MDMIYQKYDDGTGVIRREQWNTYDSCMYGANTFIGSYWVTALKAAAAMAALVGDHETAAKYRERAGAAAQQYESICWREEFGYYVADVTEKDCQHSYGPGCFVDQLCAVGLSAACGFGHVFRPDHEARARDAIRRHNKVTQPHGAAKDFQKHLFPGDSGITVCTYPHGKLKVSRALGASSDLRTPSPGQKAGQRKSPACTTPGHPHVGPVPGFWKYTFDHLPTRSPPPLCRTQAFAQWREGGGGGLRTEVCGRQKQSNDPRNNQHNPQYAIYRAPLTHKRHTTPHSTQPRHTNYWAPRTRKRHQQEHRPQRPTERSNPTQHAKGRAGDCPGPRKGAATRRNVTQGVRAGS